jgi:hypothetical protein
LLRDVWLPDLQLAVARSYDRSTKGLYVAVKGGHNAESHNHNDVGSFIVYADGQPVLIDVGCEQYTAKTFSPQRYEIWTMQSVYHNLPTINGVQQAPGVSYAASEVNYAADNKKMSFSLNLAKAYPEKAAVESWKRTLTLYRKQKVEIEDVYRLTQVITPTVWHWMTGIKPDTSKPGKIVLADKDKTIELLYDASLFSIEVNEITVTDRERLIGIWGNRLYRINLTENNGGLTGRCKLSVIYKK